MSYTVLVPVDDSEDRARAQAAFVTDLPAPSSVRAHVTHALSREEREAPTSMQSVDRIATVRQVVETLEAAGVETQVQEIGEPPAASIIDLAGGLDVDAVVLGGRKRSPAGKALFGSVTQQVILGSDRPVVVTGGANPDDGPTAGASEAEAEGERENGDGDEGGGGDGA
jgi:nucleotide-binding universal stress UspA family protein